MPCNLSFINVNDDGHMNIVISLTSHNSKVETPTRANTRIHGILYMHPALNQAVQRIMIDRPSNE